MTAQSQIVSAAGNAGLAALDGIQVPRIAVAAFCETQAAADTIAAAAADRRMARATVTVRTGGIAGAVGLYRESRSPELLILESRASSNDLLGELEDLADSCDADTKVMVIGTSNDVMLYRELLDRGIADYLVAPVSEASIIAAVGRVYRDSSPRKPGRTCAFVGAKGGAGASTVAHNVAWTLAGELDATVVLADLDFAFGTAGLDFNIDADQGIAQALDASTRLDELLLDRLLAPCNERLSLLTAPAALGTGYDFNETAFEHMLEIARGRAPMVVLDVPHLWTAWARRILASVDEVVIVAEADLASLRNARSLVEFLTEARPNDAPPKLVLNRVAMPKRPEIKPAEFAAALRLEPTARIAFDPALFGAAANKGCMIADVSARAQACGAFAEVARAIGGQSNVGPRRKAPLGARLRSLLSPGRQRAVAIPSGARP